MTSHNPDKSMMMDILNTEKYVVSTYAMSVCECVNQNIRRDFQRIENEEHDIQYTITQELTNRGWYQTQPADQQQIKQVTNSYSNPQFPPPGFTGPETRATF